MAAKPGLVLTDRLVSYDGAGNEIPLVGSLVTAIPVGNLPIYLEQVDSTFVELQKPYPTATTDDTGTFTLKLPAQSDSKPDTLTWMLKLPDQTTLTGPVTDAMVTASTSAPLTLYALRTTYMWS